MNSIELFTGAGGLALGLANSGFKHLFVSDFDFQACDTLRRNSQHLELIKDLEIRNCDIRTLKFKDFNCDVDLLAGGVPCQPFSIGGKHQGHTDERNMFPEMIRAIRHLKPKAVMIENVRGLKRPSFAHYFGYIELMIMYPEIEIKPLEKWFDHLERLQRYHMKGKPQGLYYRLVVDVLNAADFGIPQKRERVFIVAIRSDLNVEFSFPLPTHSEEALVWNQDFSQEYWEEHKIPKSKRTKTLRNQRIDHSRPILKPWKTVRDAISNLPPPTARRSEFEPNLTHFFIPGAKTYPGHTGSPMDQPAKTLKAGDHGVPGGENMMRLDDGQVRYFTIRESARLQTFPDQFIFPFSWTESMRQIGNAVPVRLAEIVGSKLHATLQSS